MTDMALVKMWVLFLCREDPLEEDRPLQYYCLGNPMDRGAWWVTIVKHHLATKPPPPPSATILSSKRKQVQIIFFPTLNSWTSFILQIFDAATKEMSTSCI